MAECRCGTCEHCTVTAPVRPTRKLLTKSQVKRMRRDHDRGVACTWSIEDIRALFVAYETAVRLLEEVVRHHPPDAPGFHVEAQDVAWLALREAER